MIHASEQYFSTSQGLSGRLPVVITATKSGSQGTAVENIQGGARWSLRGSLWDVKKKQYKYDGRVAVSVGSQCEWHGRWRLGRWHCSCCLPSTLPGGLSQEVRRQVTGAEKQSGRVSNTKFATPLTLATLGVGPQHQRPQVRLIQEPQYIALGKSVRGHGVLCLCSLCPLALVAHLSLSYPSGFPSRSW